MIPLQPVTPTPPPNPTPIPPPLLQVKAVNVSYHHRHVLTDVNLELAPGETLGLVGESGSGKSTLARAILGLTHVQSGTIVFDGVDLTHASPRQMRTARRNLQVIFQDPGASLNPRMQVGEIVAEPLIVHNAYAESSAGQPRREWLALRVRELLHSCGLAPDAASRYPHQFSGGQKQRIAIARALALKPKLIICDEPTSALDVSVQAQIINLLTDLRAEYGIAYLFISHDLGVVSHVCQRLAVMLAGRIVEQGPVDEVLSSPAHKYTRELLAAAIRGSMEVPA